MDRYQYLMFDCSGACFHLAARVRLPDPGVAEPRRLLAALVPTVLVFGAWDAVAIARDHWSCSERLTTGVEVLPGFPIDEIVFFPWSPRGRRRNGTVRRGHAGPLRALQSRAGSGKVGG